MTVNHIDTHTAQTLTLTRRLRRLRRTETMRALVRETRLSPDMFVLPLFVCEGEGVRREVPSMPGVFNLSVDEAVKEVQAAKGDGVNSVLLFGLPDRKDDIGSLAYDPEAPVQSAIRAIKREVADVPGHDRRLPVRVHRPRPLRDRDRRGDRERSDGRSAGARRGVARGGGRGHRRAVRHDGRPRRRHPAGARRARVRAHGDHGVRGEVLLRVLRAVPRRGGVGAAVRRPAVAPDGSGERRRGAARGRAGHRRRRRHRDGEAGGRLSRRHRPRQGARSTTRPPRTTSAASTRC